MKSNLRAFLFLSLLFLPACQMVPQSKPAPTSPPTLATAMPAERARRPVLLVPTLISTPTPAPTADPVLKTVQAYADALQRGEIDSAAALLSDYSLMVAELTRSEAAAELQARMSAEQWSDFQIHETRAISPKTVLAHVTYNLQIQNPTDGNSVTTPADEWWPVRLENGQWRYNRANLVDFVTLDVEEQTTAGLTIKPTLMERYSDRILLSLLVQNRTNEPIVLGQVNETMAAFLFGDRRVEAEKNRLIFEPLRSYPDATVMVKGQFDSYPDGVVIREWKNVTTAPWYDFRFDR
jgi:hypothetical protein